MVSHAAKMYQEAKKNSCCTMTLEFPYRMSLRRKAKSFVNGRFK